MVPYTTHTDTHMHKHYTLVKTFSHNQDSKKGNWSMYSIPLQYVAHYVKTLYSTCQEKEKQGGRYPVLMEKNGEYPVPNEKEREGVRFLSFPFLSLSLSLFVFLYLTTLQLWRIPT